MGSFHRRRFLAGGAALATFTIVPRHVLGEFTNDTEANQYLHRQYRQGWSL